jgi:predicted ribosomally synthesized peptide with SipW-like signal peptide
MSDDDTYDLSRRKILGGIVTVGAAGATAGAGTMALFSDTEQSTGNTIQAGTLDLTADGNNGEATTTIDVGPIAPGDGGSKMTTLKNTGTLSGNLNVDFGVLINNENGLEEPEKGADGEDDEEGDSDMTGELGRAHAAEGAHALDIKAGFGNDGTIETVILNSKNKDPRNNISGVTGIEYNPNHSIGSEGAEVDFIVEYSLPSEAGNAVQGDGVEFDVTFELLQQSAGSSVAITGNSPLSDYNWNPDSSEAHTGDGSWRAHATASDPSNVEKRNIYFASEFSSFHDLPSFTVDDIADISYWLKSSSLGSANVFLTIYTKPENDEDNMNSWYDSRLQALPNNADGGSVNFQGGEWNKFGTSTGAHHQMRFWDHPPDDVSGSEPPASDLPTLADLQGSDYTWPHNDPPEKRATHSYHDEEVLALSLGTGSTDTDVDAYLDDITLKLSNETFSIDLEP